MVWQNALKIRKTVFISHYFQKQQRAICLRKIITNSLHFSFVSYRTFDALPDEHRGTPINRSNNSFFLLILFGCEMKFKLSKTGIFAGNIKLYWMHLNEFLFARFGRQIFWYTKNYLFNHMTWWSIFRLLKICIEFLAWPFWNSMFVNIWGSRGRKNERSEKFIKNSKGTNRFSLNRW